MEQEDAAIGAKQNAKGKNLYQKIVGSHLKIGEMLAGNEIGIEIDQTLTQDALGVMSYLQFEAIGVKYQGLNK